MRQNNRLIKRKFEPINRNSGAELHVFQFHPHEPKRPLLLQREAQASPNLGRQSKQFRVHFPNRHIRQCFSIQALNRFSESALTRSSSGPPASLASDPRPPDPLISKFPISPQRNAAPFLLQREGEKKPGSSNETHPRPPNAWQRPELTLDQALGLKRTLEREIDLLRLAAQDEIDGSRVGCLKAVVPFQSGRLQPGTSTPPDSRCPRTSGASGSPWICPESATGSRNQESPAYF